MNRGDDRPLVLVVDDDPEFREEILPEALGRLNARVLTAQDVLEARLVAAEHDADTNDPLNLVVLDMQMPRHGAEVETAEDGGIQFLRPYHRPDCPVVVFTAYPSYRNCVRAARAGAAAYLPKKEHDAFGGPEGGIDGLIETCRCLLTTPPAGEMRLPTNEDLIAQRYDALSLPREEFGDRWAALVPASKARSAGMVGTERAGLVVVTETSRERLAQLIIDKLPILGDIPHVKFVPRRE